MLRSRFVAAISSVCLIVLGAGMVLAQDYPSKPIRIVTGSVGGGNDAMSRQIAQGISGPLGQPVIVENRGTGFLSAEVVYKSPPDGYTLLVGAATLWMSAFFQKVPYDAVRDFSPVSLISRDVNVLVVHPSLPVKSVRELIALAKSRPGELNYGSGSRGSSSHLAAELLKHMAGVNIVWVSYKGSAPVITALIGGEVQLTLLDPGLVAPHLKSGRLRALAVTSGTPSALAPDLPTVAASDLPGYEVVGMTVMLAPAKTPDAIVNRLNQEVVRVLNLPDVKERLLTAGSEVVASSPGQLAVTMKSEIAKWGKVIKDAGIKFD